MYTKEELEQMATEQLLSISEELGLNVSPDGPRDTIIYAILDKIAEDSAANGGSGAKRKRVRITKKDTDKVYTVKGKKGENLDSGNSQKDSATPSIFLEPAEEAPVKKRRGRKPKAEQAQAAPTEEAAPEAAEPAKADAVADDPAETAVAEPQDTAAAAENEQPLAEVDSEEEQPQAVEDGEAQQPQAVDRKAAATDDAGEGYWEGDPGDGTDFITVVDLPIEDYEAQPSLDIFDRPIAQAEADGQADVLVAQADEDEEEFDFDQLISASGVLEILAEGYGFLRSSDYNYLSSPDDIYVSPQQIKKYSLKTGDVVECCVVPPHDDEKFFTISSVSLINGRTPSDVRDRVSFEHLTPLFPEEKFCLCGDRATTNPSTRIVDLFAPIGKGQRALIVAQPKTGKTILMKDIANAIAANHPEAYIMMLLIDERPEEVTDMARTVKAEVIASTFDEPADRHVKIAGIVLEKAKRMVECGHDVVIFLDSITRLARAYNTVAPASGKVLTGGVDANALQKPKRFFGAARKIEGGGSLTIIATALVDTGSKMDEVIFEEFKGTGNSEIQLDRMLSNKRIFPALNLIQTSTRRDDLLQDPTTLNRMWIIRKFISEMNPIEAMNTVRDRLMQSRNNDEFLMSMNG